MIPFYKYFTPHINKLAKDLNFIPVNKISNKLNNIIRIGKDKDPIMNRCGAIYKINCIDCDACYVGQSGRKLEKRVKEHINDLKNNNWKSALVQHNKGPNHIFDLSNIETLDFENNKSKRLFSETLNIEFFNKNTINRMEDTQNLKMIYKNSVNMMVEKGV